MPIDAGYSGTPLAKKLGIKEGFTVLGINAPYNFRELLGPLPTGVEILENARTDFDIVHFLRTAAVNFSTALPSSEN